MTADFVELVIHLLQFGTLLADPKDQAKGKPTPRRSVRWAPWVIASNAIVGVGVLGLVGYWLNLGRSLDQAVTMLGLLLGMGCLGLAAWMADETDLAGTKSPANPAALDPKKVPDPEWGEF